MAKNFRVLHDQVMARPGAAERATRLRQETLAEIGLYQLRIDSQLDPVQRREITESTFSRIEHAEDLRICTLRNFVEGIGGQLKIDAEFPDGRRITLRV